jgi:hypothetical protein
VAIATGVMKGKGVEGGKPYTRRERFVDTWVFKHGAWVCIGTNATPVSAGHYVPAKSHENRSELNHNPEWLGVARLSNQWRS